MRLEDKIPGLREAITKERFLRNVAFLGLTETICGIECRQLTLLDVVRLDSIGCPFVSGGIAARHHVFEFLKLQQSRRCFRHWLAMVTLEWEIASEEIHKFVEESFSDAPDASNGSGVAYWTIAQDYIHIFGESYGWSAEQTMSLPLRALFPQYSVIRKFRNPSVPLFNPISDKVRGNWLAEENNRNQN